MGTRIKPASGIIEDLDDVNEALRDIGLAQKELDAIDAEANKKIADIKTAAAKKGEALRTKITEQSQKIMFYAEDNKKDLFAKARSIDLEFGKFGYRKSTKVAVKKDSLDLIHKLIDMWKAKRDSAENDQDKVDAASKVSMWEGCYIVKETVSKDGLSKFDNSELAQVHAKKVESDDFFCEPSTEEINKDLLRARA